MNGLNRIFRFLLLATLLQTCTYSMDMEELQGHFESREFSKIIDAFKKNPGNFQDLGSLTLLGASHHELKQSREALQACIKAMHIQPGGLCAQVLRDIRTKEREIYEFEMASYYLDSADFETALIKLFPLSQKKPKDQAVRVALAKAFQGMNRYDFMQEQLWQVDKENEDYKELKGRLFYAIGKIVRNLRRKPAEQLMEFPTGPYSVVLHEQKQNKMFYPGLLKHYEDIRNDETVELTEEEALRLANLYLIGGDVDRAYAIADEYKDKVGFPTSILSLESLYLRLPKRKQVAKVVASPATEEELEENLTPYERYIKERKPGKYRPFDFTEVELATPDNLTPFHNLEATYRKRLDEMETPGEKRWLYEQVSDKFNLMWSDHINPDKHAIATYFLKDHKGAKFLKEIEEYHEKYEQEDKRNASYFKGSTNKLKQRLAQAKDSKEKVRILRQVQMKWNSLEYSSMTDVRMRGAWREYLKTEDGERYLETITSELKSLGLYKELKYGAVRRFH